MPTPWIPPITYLPPVDTGHSVVFADRHLIVADKPAGLLSVPGRDPAHRDCLIARLQPTYPDALIVHRLDMATSGLLVLARGPAVHRELSRAFRERAVHKRYIALVAGLLADDAGEIDLPLICDWPNRPRQKIDHNLGKPSLTRYRVLARDTARGQTRVALEPVTGRSHQLRVHLAALGHPILGDPLYGTTPPAPGARLDLHAEYLAFRHPASGDSCAFSRPAPF